MSKIRESELKLQDELLMTFLDQALAMTKAQKGSVFLVDPENECLRLIGARGSDYLEVGARIRIDDSQLLKKVLSEKKPFLVQNIEEDPRIRQKNNPRYGNPSFLSLPISEGENAVTAVVSLSSKETGETFDARDADTLSVLQTGIHFRLENSRLHSQLALAEERQKKLLEDLIHAEKLAAVGTCMAGVAHEVKNPLAIIIQGVEYLKSVVGSDAMLLDVVERIKKAALRADTIVKGLLSFTRQVPIQAQDEDIPSLIDEAILSLADQMTVKAIDVIKNYEPALPAANIDGDQIRQVLVNILLNAVEAMAEQGRITIRVAAGKDVSGEEQIEIVIGDTGPGIPAGVGEKIFDPFFTTKNAGGNVGLGLSITKGIIDKHRGRMSIESAVGKGTTVLITLPVGHHGHTKSSEGEKI